MIDAGKTSAAKGDYSTAAIHFKTALQDKPEWGEARFRLGEALLASGDPAGAVAQLERALDQKYPADQVVPSLARAMLVTGEFTKLTSLYGETTFSDKLATASLKSSIAAAWAAQGDAEKTRRAVDESLALAPDLPPARLLQARTMAGQGEFAQASEIVEKLLSRDASMHEAWLLKGEIALQKKDAKAGESAFRKALELHPDFAPGHLALINLHFAEGDIGKVKSQLAQMQSLLPNNPSTLYVAALVAYRTGEFSQARELSQRLLLGSPDNLAALLLSGTVQAQMGSLILAESHFAKALQVNPQFYPARVNLAQVYLRLGQAAKALDTLKPLLGRDGPASAQANALAGDAELRLGNTEAAEASFRRASALDPSNDRVGTALALSRLSRGEANAAFSDLAMLSGKSKDGVANQAIVTARLRRGELNAALAAADAMTAKQPKSASAFALKGRVHLARGDLAGARAAFDEALRLDPALFDATSNLANIDVAEGKPAAARQRLEASIKSDLQNVYPRLALAKLQVRLGTSPEELRTTLDDSIRLAPGVAEPRLMLFDALLRRRQFKEALEQARQALSTMPNDAVVLEAVGRVQLQAGEGDQALSTFRRLAGLLPDSDVPYVRLGEAYRRSGQQEAAEAAYKQAIDIRPSSAAAQDGLLQLLKGGSRQREIIGFGQALQRSRPADPFGFLLEGAGYSLAKNPDAAIATYRKALVSNRDSAPLASALFLALDGNGRGAEAERFATDWSKAHPNDVDFGFEVSKAASGHGDLDRAEAILRKLVAKQAFNPILLNNLAWILADRNRTDALAVAQRAANLLPADASVIDTLAHALAADKQYAKALTTQRRAVELAPNEDILRLNLARVAIQAGDKELARTELARLKSLGASFAQQAEVSKLLAAV